MDVFDFLKAADLMSLELRAEKRHEQAEKRKFCTMLQCGPTEEDS